MSPLKEVPAITGKNGCQEMSLVGELPPRIYPKKSNYPEDSVKDFLRIPAVSPVTKS